MFPFSREVSAGVTEKKKRKKEERKKKKRNIHVRWRPKSCTFVFNFKKQSPKPNQSD